MAARVVVEAVVVVVLSASRTNVVRPVVGPCRKALSCGNCKGNRTSGQADI